MYYFFRNLGGNRITVIESGAFEDVTVSWDLYVYKKIDVVVVFNFKIFKFGKPNIWLIQ